MENNQLKDRVANQDKYLARAVKKLKGQDVPLVPAAAP